MNSNQVSLKHLWILLLTILVYGCDTNSNICDLPNVPTGTFLVSLLEEDSQQDLIGDSVSGSIYDYNKVKVYFNGVIKPDGLRTTRIRINDWHMPLQADTLLSLEYHIELPHIQIPNRIDRDTLLIEYRLRDPVDCEIPINPRFNDIKELSYIRVSYNQELHYEGSGRNSFPIRLDRI